MCRRKINNPIFFRVFSLWLLFLSLPLVAQPQEPRYLGPFEFRSSLLVEYIEDDNLFQTSTQEVETGITLITPSFDLVFDNGISGFSLGYSLEDATFSDVSGEDYTDQRVIIEAGTLFGEIHRVDFAAFYRESHDRLSEDGRSSISEGSISNDSLDEFEDVDYEASYILGADDSLLGFSASAGLFERTYVNNRFDRSVSPPSPVTALLDREEIRYRLEVFWNVSPDIRAGLSYTNTDIEFVIPQASRDAEEDVVAVELSWTPVETISIDASLGQTDRETDAGVNDKSEFWDIEIDWSITEYSSLNLFTSNSTDEADLVGEGFSVRSDFGFVWQHEWVDNFNTELSYVKADIDFSLGGEEDSERVVVRVNYRFRPWFGLSLYLQDIDVESSAGANSFDQRIYGIGALFSF